MGVTEKKKLPHEEPAQLRLKVRVNVSTSKCLSLQTSLKWFFCKFSTPSKWLEHLSIWTVNIMCSFIFVNVNLLDILRANTCLTQIKVRVCESSSSRSRPTWTIARKQSGCPLKFGFGTHVRCSHQFIRPTSQLICIFNIDHTLTHSNKFTKGLDL